MSNHESNTHLHHKSEQLWPMACELVEQHISRGVWAITQWQLNGFNLSPQDDTENRCLLELYRDERTDYRFNLSSQQPKLFLVMENNDTDEMPNLLLLTASQNVAGQYMDGDYLVLSAGMPLPVQAWMEAFIGRNGELLEVRRKKRKGAGRASGK
ncbi:DUF3305 domain-containing protein [Vibrio sp. CAU 1672]|uniref:DUF3305 domain-containing protein n=1 Tax=Vibrio sp. CAU 1672 TaxID=3032594 RepID=UPI0023DB6BD6|nr:DUF3305 domain-containing protein [Vibrio sp. CAU 1672]MDF2152211.1 DUF3305 domain-containing protein [Vibrio sp. CAU 1672]